MHVGIVLFDFYLLSAARISLIIQNLSIAVCAALLYIVIVYKPEIEATWHNSGLLYLGYGVIILVAILAQLASAGNTIAVEKDWIVEICRGDNDLLASKEHSRMFYYNH